VWGLLVLCCGVCFLLFFSLVEGMICGSYHRAGRRLVVRLFAYRKMECVFATRTTVEGQSEAGGKVDHETPPPPIR